MHLLPGDETTRRPMSIQIISPGASLTMPKRVLADAVVSNTLARGVVHAALD